MSIAGGTGILASDLNGDYEQSLNCKQGHLIFMVDKLAY